MSSGVELQVGFYVILLYSDVKSASWASCFLLYWIFHHPKIAQVPGFIFTHAYLESSSVYFIPLVTLSNGPGIYVTPLF
jgi:hypothetical protein